MRFDELSCLLVDPMCLLVPSFLHSMPGPPRIAQKRRNAGGIEGSSRLGPMIPILQGMDFHFPRIDLPFRREGLGNWQRRVLQVHFFLYALLMDRSRPSRPFAVVEM